MDPRGRHGALQGATGCLFISPSLLREVSRFPVFAGVASDTARIGRVVSKRLVTESGRWRPSNVRHAWQHTTNEAMRSNASHRLSPHGALGSFSNRALPHHRSQVSEFRPVSVLSYPRNGFLRFARLTDEAALSGASAGSAVPMVSVGPWAGRGLLFVLLGVSLWQILARGFSSGETPPPPLPANTFACLRNCRDRRLT